jgi:hypothetical protein
MLQIAIYHCGAYFSKELAVIVDQVHKALIVPLVQYQSHVYVYPVFALEFRCDSIRRLSVVLVMSFV